MTPTTLHFCTLFNKNYLLRGLTLISSLQKYEDDFHLYILAMDESSAHTLKELKLKNTTIIPLAEFESPALLAVKPQRSVGEYCWTCTPLLIKYCLERFQLTNCTYLDADIYFFASPRVLIKEASSYSIMITEHRYTPSYDQTKIAGKYCVQFMYFQNDEDGLRTLTWWQDRCLEWCYSRYEEGKFGDQKYLDDWLTRFNKVHELQNLGGGLGPWNIQQYKLKKTSPLQLTEKRTGTQFEGIFYHFHGLKLFKNGLCDLGYYRISEDVLSSIYAPYLRHMESLEQDLSRGDFEFGDYGSAQTLSPYYFWKSLKRYLKGHLNRYKIKDIRERVAYASNN